MSSTDHGQGNALSAAQPSMTGLDAIRGNGAWIEASDGNRYLDLAAGIATCNLGHSHPAVIAAAHHQMERVIHLGGTLGHRPMHDLADRLVEITPGPIERFLFLTTGSEANLGAADLARRATGRKGIVIFGGGSEGLHGPDVHTAPFPRPDEPGLSEQTAAERALEGLDRLHDRVLPGADTACYLVEPVQGRAGNHPGGRPFLAGLRERADRHGALLVFDEIQTGMGRTGEWFAAQTYGVDPDVITMGKAIGGGFPLSALGAPGEVMDTMRPGDHGSTFGGHPVSCAAGLAGIEAMEAEGLPAHAGELGAVALARLGALAERHPQLSARGLGLMLGVEVLDPDTRDADPALAAAIESAVREEGVLLIRSGPDGNVIRVLPPLVITDDELDMALGAIEKAAEAACGGGSTS